MTFISGLWPGDDRYINYLLGTFMIICFLISTTLNPLIFYSYTKKNKTIQNFLFKVIAFTDFLTNLVPAVFMGYVFLSNVKFQYTFLNQLPEFFSCTFGCISQVTTTMMAVTRMISIIKPFVRVKFKYVLAYLIFYTVYMAIGNAGTLVLSALKEYNYKGGDTEHDGHPKLIETIETLNKFVCFVMNVLHCSIGIMCSFVTVLYLRYIMLGDPKHAMKLRSCTTILIMNVPYIISIVSNFLAFYQVVAIDFKLVNHYMLPILTSAFNPCVIVARTDAIRVVMSSAHKDGRSRANTAATFYHARSQMVLFENPAVMDSCREVNEGVRVRESCTERDVVYVGGSLTSPSSENYLIMNNDHDSCQESYKEVDEGASERGRAARLRESCTEGDVEDVSSSLTSPTSETCLTSPRISGNCLIMNN